MLPRRRRTRVLLAALGLVLVAGAVAAIAVYRTAVVDPGNVSNPEVEFDAEPPPPEPPPRDRSQWPLYGFSKDHRRFYRPPRRLPIRGAWKMVWRHRAPALLEFPPVIYRGSIYQLADNGVIFALRKNTGRKRWRRDLGHLSASSPAIGGGSLYVTLLERRRGVRAGRVVSLWLDGGRLKWSRNLPARSESSPLLHRGRIYFGTEGGTLYCLNAHNGRTVWRYQADGAIKGSPTLSNGKLYFGDYGGHVHAVRLSNGRRVWEAAPAARALRSGRFYATAAVAFGRVYIGSTDGRMYSLSARTGRLAWARQTGHYVYSSAAVHAVPRVGPTVFFGSYDGHLYALNARTGAVRWRHRSGGKISGGATIVGRAVFFADLGKRVTIGLSLATGRVFFRRKPGAFDPIVSDGRHLFQTGRSSLTALLPAAEARRVLRERRERARERRERARERREREGARGRERARERRAGERRRARARARRRAERRAERRAKARALRRCRRHTTRAARRRCARRVERRF
ncbi:MAG TPA: PQQ-binding-like beta-propeller repeat protein [Solirubrobacteraceae bacterium]|nr:PQQ-binding-like beta-propeller repeat protein [Solirubrobacteraceae bacterium]